MAYIGNEAQTAFTSFDKQTITGDGTATYTLSHSVANEQEVEVFVNNVRQEGGSGKAYTVSGNQITFSENIASTDDCYVVFQGKALQTVVPPAGSVTDSMITGLSSSKLTGALPALDGSALTGISGALKKIQFIPIPPKTITGSTSIIPRDNTVPLITEGHLVVQADYTPAETTSTIFVDAFFHVGERSNVANTFAGALFLNDTCVNARCILGRNNQAVQLKLQASFANTTGNALDIEVRCDQNSYFEINGSNLGTGSTTYTSAASSAFGGTDAMNQTFITVTEF